MNDHIADILAEDLEAIERGEISLEEALVRHPENRDEVASLLRLAAAIQKLDSITPRPGFRYTARARLLREISARQQSPRGGRLKRVFQFSFPRLILKPALSLAIVIIVLVATLSAGTAYAAQGALPGDSLYPVKITLEDAQLALAGEDTQASLYLQFADERLQEINSLVARGRYEDLSRAATRFEDLMQAGRQSIDDAALEDGGRIEVEALHLNQDLEYTQGVLQSVLQNGNLPGNSEQGLQRALNASAQVQSRLKQLFPNWNPPGLPGGIPPGQSGDTPIGPPDKSESQPGVGPQKEPGPPEGKGPDKDKDKDKPNKPDKPSNNNPQGSSPDVTQGPPADKGKPEDKNNNSSKNPSGGKP